MDNVPPGEVKVEYDISDVMDALRDTMKTTGSNWLGALQNSLTAVELARRKSDTGETG
jgi:hypothetical protein